MKRTGFLIEKIIEPENMRLAFWKAQKGKQHRPEVVEFRSQLQDNLSQLAFDIEAGTYELGDYHYFTIHDPKKRCICAASFRERVLHHAVMNVCDPVFEKYQIFDSYACRREKGTYAALNRARDFSRRYSFFMKLDVRKYFDSVSHKILMKGLIRLFKDQRLLNLFNAIIGSYETREGCGIPIGNLTSQYFANQFLAPLDHFIKEKMKIRGYVRYMDDMVLWSNNQDQLKTAHQHLADKLSGEYDLELKNLIINTVKSGLPFLGYTVYTSVMKLSSKSKIRFRKKMKRAYFHLIEGNWDQQIFQRHVSSIVAFAEHAESLDFRKKVQSQFGY